jgi:hypothetical protein
LENPRAVAELINRFAARIADLAKPA